MRVENSASAVRARLANGFANYTITGSSCSNGTGASALTERASVRYGGSLIGARQAGRPRIDGLRALLKVSNEDPDLLILDLHLPDVEGFRVCERLRDPKFRPLPVIMLTASTDQKTLRRCEELGAVHIQKGPQLWDELSVAMRCIFETSKAKDEKLGATEVARAPKVLLVDDDAL